MEDIQNQQIQRDDLWIEHGYGERVHVLANPIGRTLLATLGDPATRQPRFNRLVDRLYDLLLDAAVIREFPGTPRSVPTRMENVHPGTAIAGELFARDTRVVIAAIARAGLLPAARCHDRLMELLDPEGIRIDHLFMSRRSSATGEIVGVECRGTKIGGDLENKFLLIPDPMGATGSTLRYVLELYSKEVGGRPRKVVVLHLVVTPEYVRALGDRYPEVEIYALRVDRGLSDPDGVW